MMAVIVANRQFVSHYEIKHTIVNNWVVLLLTLSAKHLPTHVGVTRLPVGFLDSDN